MFFKAHNKYTLWCINWLCEQETFGSIFSCLKQTTSVQVLFIAILVLASFMLFDEMFIAMVLYLGSNSGSFNVVMDHIWGKALCKVNLKALWEYFCLKGACWWGSFRKQQWHSYEFLFYMKSYLLNWNMRENLWFRYFTILSLSSQFTKELK